MQLLNQTYVKYALMQCAALILCLTLMEVTGNNLTFEQKPIFQVIFVMITPFIIWFLGIRAKKAELKNKMSFKQGFNEGFKISVVFGILSVFIFLVYYLFINTFIIESVKFVYGMPDGSNSAVIAIDLITQFLSSIIFGSLYSAIIAFILKSKN